MNILDIAPVVPVVVLDDPDRAVPLARALLDGGVGIIEITLRTNAALPAIEAIAAEVPEMVVGAGTLVTPLQVEAAAAAGAGFLVSPGTTPHLLDALADTGLPYLPGVATISEILTVLDRGITEMKFFPAESSGGTAALRAFAGPLPQIRFCPTGGITPATVRDYLSLPNVGCVGGSWLTPAAALAAADWPSIKEAAAAAAALRE
ncbi:bifunctional 4-hydroxy-2-oxoglutarate aldolase/2-dehydro-3-deoxy-phosphogluconate aldolase [Nocardia sp. CA2R105]|uniref:bifunctional 4-hydroxy-2-oxoglutarate aldolase/2-dehydro-3-deoxy-phosphogluconate aldolase n=1 Tax=Nocardia coffeae TaxID=2873381 RepID=UPI001CA73641|nr:bifunctional 4-hydroxy-2-oxoglutarate aldolase/2-dehydro-3-deoxy-phosphogluconate aldolase [Nocardia coffeae]MBY8862792.1 bifunctional 4-hydroxy-2-oxoglutarate aldolase/2-dehydro-3-deoxy-phosphogluconate aldolase [Nocardia coffeae]